MKKLLMIIALINFSVIALSQIPEIKWQQCFGTVEIDRANSIASTENGYLIAIRIQTDGSGITNYHGESDAWIINIDTTGNIIWERCFGGSESETIHKIIKVSENEFYLFGGTESLDGDISCDTNYGLTDFWVVKIDGLGNIIWDYCYGSPATDYSRDAVVTPDGGLLFMGRIFTQGGDVSIHYGAYDIWFCKIDSLGTMEWEKTIGNEEIDNAIDLKLTSDSTFAFIGGYYESGGMIDCEVATTGSGADLWLVELSLDGGEIINQYCYGGSHDEVGFQFEKIEDGYILVGGTLSNDGDVSGLHGPTGDPNYADIWAVRVDDQGEIIWQRCLGGYDNEVPFFITQVEDGGFIVIGNTSSHNGDVTGNNSWPGGSWSDIWVVKLTPDGEIEWDQCYGGVDTERFISWNSIVKKGDYNYVIGTQAKTASGDVQCTLNSGSSEDAWVFEIDLEDTTNVIEQGESKQAIKVYPNPAMDYVVFELDLQGLNIKTLDNQGVLKIKNVFGQEVSKISFKSETTIWDTKGIKSGIYFYSTFINKKNISGKIIIE